MADSIKIPMFPLSIFPLPGEMVPLHIFEPRYRQLLEEAEAKDISFGIYFSHVANIHKYGALVKLESVIKRYAGGESDIIVKSYDLFTLHTLYRTYRDKLYPGGEVTLFESDLTISASPKLISRFVEYMQFAKIGATPKNISVFHIANELNLDFDDKLKLVGHEGEKRETILYNQLNYHLQLLQQAEKAKDVFHLN
jgi:uncharacterized protein